MASPTTLPPKKDVARGLLLRGSIFVHLDPRRDGVRVPEWLRAQPQVVLQVGLDMPVPITDLRVDDAGVYGTLSFQRTPFACMVPWDAVFALVGDDGKGMVWPDDLPAEIAAEVEREAQRGHGTNDDRGDSAGTKAPQDGERARGGRKPTPRGGRPRAVPLTAEAATTAGPTPARAPRPAVAMVPSDEAPRGVPTDAEEASAVTPMGRDGTPQPSREAPSQPGRKPKRELPPYLRVIK